MRAMAAASQDLHRRKMNSGQGLGTEPSHPAVETEVSPPAAVLTPRPNAWSRALTTIPSHPALAYRPPPQSTSTWPEASSLWCVWLTLSLGGPPRSSALSRWGVTLVILSSIFTQGWQGTSKAEQLNHGIAGLCKVKDDANLCGGQQQPSVLETSGGL